MSSHVRLKGRAYEKVYRRRSLLASRRCDFREIESPPEGQIILAGHRKGDVS